jgi:hypothetical protein
LLDSQYQRAQDLLVEHRDKLEALAMELLDKEVLLKSDLVKLIGPRPIDVDTPEHAIQGWSGVVDNNNGAAPTNTPPPPPHPTAGEDI